METWIQIIEECTSDVISADNGKTQLRKGDIFKKYATGVNDDDDHTITLSYKHKTWTEFREGLFWLSERYFRILSPLEILAIQLDEE